MTAVDPRLYILGGLLVLGVVVLVYLIGALVRYRRAVRAAVRPVVDVIPDYEPEVTTGVDDQLEDDIFAVEPGLTDSTLGAPLRTGAWRPDGQSSAPMWAPQVPPIAVLDQVAPAIVVDAEPELDEPAVVRETVPSPEPTLVPVSVPELESEPEPEPEPSTPDAESLPEPAPAPMPVHAPELKLPPEPELRPEPAQVVVPAPEPDVMARLAEQLRDLEPPRAPAGPTVVHAPVEMAPDSLLEQARGTDPAPLSTGSILSAARNLTGVELVEPVDPAGVSAVQTDAPRAVAAEAPAAPDASSTSDSDHEYSLVAPVELYFTLGEGRVGVKQGSRTFAEFQRLADVLIADLHAAERRPHS